MSRYWLTPFILLAGCQGEINLPGPEQFSTWEKLTPHPVFVGPPLWRYCREPLPAEDKTRAEEAKKNGPHAEGWIVTRANSLAALAWKGKPFGNPMPVGSIVVKEKFGDETAAKGLNEFTLMIKREHGYYPAGGDWEYAYLERGEIKARGRLEHCAKCHATAPGNNFLFTRPVAGN